MHDQGTDGDSHIHIARKGKVTDRPAVYLASTGFEFIDYLHGSNLGCSGQGPGRKSRPENVESIPPLLQLSSDVGNDVHDMGIAFDHHQLTDLNGTRTGDAAHVIAPKVDQHDMLSPFLGIAKQFLFKLPVFFWRSPSGSGPGNGAHFDAILFFTDKDFRRGAYHHGGAESKKKHIRGRIDRT